MHADGHVGGIRLIAHLDGILVKGGVVVSLEMTRASEPLVARRAIIRLWSASLVALPGLVSHDRFRSLWQHCRWYLVS